MTQQYLNKIVNFFGEQGLIIQAKANEFYTGKSLTKNDLIICFDVVSLPNSPLMNRVSISNYMACTLYFQSSYFPSAIQAFYKFVEKNLKDDDPINKENLYRAFNVIEFEHKYRYCSPKELTFLINYLNKFSSMSKTLLEFILFKVYSAILLCEIKNFTRSNEQAYEAIPYITDALQRRNPPEIQNLFRFVELVNSMIVLRNEKEDEGHDLNEYCSLANSTYNQMKSVNIPLALRVGFNIFEVYFQKEEISNCLDIIKNMKYILKQQMFKEIKINNGFYIDLALASRSAFSHTFLMNKAKVLKSIRHIEDAIKLLNYNDTQNSIVKTAYEFVSVLLRFNLNRNLVKTDRINSSLDITRKMVEKVKDIKIFNMNEIYVNISVIRPNHSWALNGNKYIDSIFNSVKENPMALKHEIIPSLIFGVYNRIAQTTESILTDISTAKRTEYKNKVNSFSSEIIQLAQNNYMNFPIFKTEYIISAILKSLYVYLATLLMDKKYSQVNDYLKTFEKSQYGKEIISENNAKEKKLSTFGYISKLYGDLFFAKKDYKTALKFYLQTKDYFEEEETSQRAANNFIIGICYAFEKKDKRSIKYFTLALNQYRELFNKLKEINENNSSTAIRYEQKVRFIENFLKQFSK